ncbi:MAG: hypothetical protein JWR34_4808 [Mycobacterium sp.]|nr:hypothetical protein [Mycobacterium sp.]
MYGSSCPSGGSLCLVTRSFDQTAGGTALWMAVEPRVPFATVTRPVARDWQIGPAVEVVHIRDRGPVTRGKECRITPGLWNRGALEATSLVRTEELPEDVLDHTNVVEANHEVVRHA